MSRVVDLTQPLGPATILWPGTGEVALEDRATIAADGHFARVLHTPEHSGTHLDAPAHFFESGPTVDAIPASSLLVPCAVLDVRDQAAADPDFALGAADLERLERRDGPVAEGAAVLLATGWDERRDDPASYLGGDDPGSLRFPGFGASAAEALVARGVVGIGIDTVSVDRGSDSGLPVHRTTLEAGLWHLEGLVGIAALPARGAQLFVGALPLERGSGAPARVLALIS